MGVPEIEAFLRRLMTDADWCRRFVRDPVSALDDAALDSSEQWAVLESLRDGDEQGSEFLSLLRTRLALIGVRIGEPPTGFERVFASATRHDPDAMEP